MTPRWTAVVPVKEWATAKSRLALPPHVRGDLAQAFADDVVSALTATPEVGRVVVVSSAAGIDALVRRHGAELVVDDETSDDRLNAAVTAGVARAALEHPGAPVVVVPADLPSLTPPAVSALLSRVSGLARAVVPDASGQGTTLLTAVDPVQLVPAFGADSAARHVRLGHVVVPGVDPGLRRDVDSLADLAEALRLGVGPATGAVLRRHPQALAS